MRITLDDSLLARYPKMQIHGLIARGLAPDRLDARPFTGWPAVDANQADRVIADWKVLHKQLSGDKRSRCSIAWLVKAAASERLRRIHPLVDLYNQASLRALSPFGGEDIQRLGGALTLTLARGTERFVPLGQPEVIEHPGDGEAVWLDGAGQVVCRALNWLESDRHKITETTRDVVFVSERPCAHLPDPRAGMDWLAEQLAGVVETLSAFRLDAETPDYQLTP
ncbi:MAG: hypothetical protein JO171_06570 [Paludibacterium sp.]|uniref:B3/B4 domain-containing protein n=1 Tax=Paludibacterium sp. TaxID=1917523 RepID=UPI0025FA9D2D|nr:phenylalanine--tRNA ligase beta subunit-related protein [Paludibacterium sp.]MBV8046796.1 hypothetical protein [Paludibacterium sp.]MBV8647633.1 hypothetical protein [Paludibacterium sp.]